MAAKRAQLRCDDQAAGEWTMASALRTRSKLRRKLPLAALALAALLGGCVYAPYPGYGGGYYGAPYYAGPTVAFGGGWGWHDHGGWRR
jgi:hypothetical protein